MQRRDSYTRYPRAILWLLREGTVEIGGDETNSRPTFELTVRPLYISKSPISNLQFEADDHEYRRSRASPDDDSPVVGISFHQARGYCDWYSEVSRKPMRLPTEVEWEYACRGGVAGRRFGGEPADAHVWDADNSGGRVRPVQQKRSNGFGLHGMLGGVWEWTASLFRPYPVVDGDGRDDPDAPGPRVLRGGSYRTPRGELGCGVRRGESPDAHHDDVGFRIVRSLGRA